MSESGVSGLFFIDAAAAASRYRVLLYGQPGAGKSCAAATAPGPVLVLTADRPGAYRYARTQHDADHILEVRVIGKQTLLDAHRHVRDAQEPKPATVVVDPLGGVYDVLLKEAGGPKPQIQHHGQVQETILGFVKSFRDLDVNLVIVCHVDVLDSEEGGALRRPATGGQKLPDKVMAEMDIVAYCARVVGEGENPDRYVGLLIPERGRVTKDSTGALGRAPELNLAQWFASASAALAPIPPDEDPFTPEDEEPEPEGEQQELAA